MGGLKWRILFGLLLGMGLVGGPPAFGAAKATPSRADLARAKLDAARHAYEANVRAYAAGQGDAEKVYLWSRRWMEAEREQAEKKGGREAALESHLKRMKDLREAAVKRYQAGQAPQADPLGAGFYVAEAELWLAQARDR
jgi:outer membrane protein TolC